MKEKINDILHYILKKYPYTDDLTKTRTTKIVYLIDWEMVKRYGKQMTQVSWYFDHYGPYVSEIIDIADGDENIEIKITRSVFGGIKYLISANCKREDLEYNLLNKTEQRIIDYVIEQTNKFTWNEFMDYVYDTEPVKNSNKYSYLDLKEYIK